MEELHTLRKEVKKLRYLLELPESGPPELNVMIRWQESLGAIHDLDVAIQYLQESELELKGWAVDELRSSRRRNYLKFVAECRADSTVIPRNGPILSRGPVPKPD